MIVPNQTISLSIDIRHSTTLSQTQDTDLGELHIDLEMQTHLPNVHLSLSLSNEHAMTPKEGVYPNL